MKFDLRPLSLSSALLGSLLLVACAGGGGDSDDDDSVGGQGGSGQPAGGSSGQAGGGAPQAGAGGAPGGGAGGAAGGGEGGAGGQAAAPGGGMGGVVDDGLEPCATNPYCNDFENTAVGAVPMGSNSISQGSTLEVRADKAYSGTKSLFVETTGGASTQARLGIPIYKRFKDPKFIGYVRMMVWLDSRAETGNGRGYWDLIGMSGLQTTHAKKGAGVAFGGPDGNQRSWLIYQGGGPPVEDLSDCTKSVSPPVMPLKKWVCVEMKVDETSPTPYGLSLDGIPVSAFNLKQTNTGSDSCHHNGPDDWYVMDVRNVSIGWSHSHEQAGTGRMWIDDVVIDEKPIGCPP